MPANFSTPGPIHHFAAFRGQSQPVYLGTSVLAPEPEGEKFKIPVMNDMGGRSVPFQLVQDGETWMVYTTLNRVDLDVVRTIRALEGAGAAVGTENPTARGRLVLGVSDWSLILLNEYAAKGNVIAAANPQLNVGRQWFTCNLRKYKESTVGTRVLEVSMAVECQNVYVPALGGGGFRCYAEDNATLAPAALLALVR